MAELIEVRFGVKTLGGSRNICVRRESRSPGEREGKCIRRSFCQITIIIFITKTITNIK